MIDLAGIGRLLDGAWLTKGSGAVQGASIDTRTLEAGQAFFALPGNNVDGHDYLEQATQRGAAVAIVQRPVTAALPALLVKDVRAALWRMAEHHRSTLDCHVIAVLGSNGKTTTVRMMTSVLRQAMSTYASLRSFNNALGLPLTILNCPVGTRALVCELGEGEPGALPRFVGLARPGTAIVTSVGRAHVGALGGEDGVRAEFAKAIKAMPSDSRVIAPPADAWLRENPAAGVARAWHEGLHACFELPDGSSWRLPVPGLHNASNAAAVIAAGRHLGLSDEAIARGLDCFQPAEMRMSVRDIRGATVIVDCYNANPDSMAAALLTARDLGKGKRVVAVIGDMLELGDRSARMHADLGRRARSMGIETVCIGPASRAASETSGGHWYATVELAREHVTGLLAADTVLLIKGSRSMALERLIEGVCASAVA